MPVPGEVRTHVAYLTGGIDVEAPIYEPFPTRWMDLVNAVPIRSGMASGPGWAALANELSKTTVGAINHITAFVKADETNNVVITNEDKTYYNNAGTWTSIQDGTDYTIGSNDHIKSVWYNDVLYLAIPKSAAANALRKWTGSGNIAAVGGTPRNAHWIDWLGLYLVTAGTFDGSNNLDPYKVFRSGQGTPEVHPGDYTDMSLTPDFVLNIERLGQELVVYKQDSIGLLSMTGDPLTPFEPEYVPGRVGLAMSEALAVGGRYHFFLSNDNVYLFNGMSEPLAIGDPVIRLINDQLAAGSYVLAGYDSRSPQREGFYFLTNFGLAAGAVGPNSAATTYTYFYYDITTRQWSRGELTNIPRAIGNYWTRFGFIDQAPIPQYAMLQALDSSGGNTVYELDYTQVNRAGAAFTRRGLSTVFDMGDPFVDKTVSDVWPIFRAEASGTVTISWKAAARYGQTPSEIRSLTYDLDGDTGPQIANAVGKFHQCEVTSTNIYSQVQGVAFRWKVMK